MANPFKKLFGTRNQRVLRAIGKVVKQIHELEPDMQALTDEQFLEKTAEYKQRLTDGETLQDLLPEAFALVREASVRVMGMRHFDVQMIGGIVLHDGKVAEMRTGEGKTLSATLPVYLNALTGKGVHLVTVNDYLAERDAKWMQPLYEFLGLTVGVNLSTSTPEEKKAAYAADVTYGTNNEFGFDYLRDNMVYEAEQMVQRPLHFCIVDEVDSILIDEARTPLIISGQAESSSDLYSVLNDLVPKLKLQTVEEDPKNPVDIPEEERGDFTLDEKHKAAHLTERGHQTIENMLAEKGVLKDGKGLYDIANITIMHYLMAALRAHHLFQRDVDYIVKNNEVMIVDEHTGRLMEGRRWSDGLHQAVEAKEGVPIQLENQTLATITFQNYFRLYEKLAGMTGTADTEAFELHKIYGLEVVVIPTNKPTARKDHGDKVYLNEAVKYREVVKEIQERHEKGQPILVGTASIENSEHVASLLKKAGVPHEVLNAKQHEREANIIIEAGRPGAVTIATNMAGRGTDIVLGGNLEAEIAALDNPSEEKIAELTAAWKQRNQDVLDAGGLHVLGTERHESRRIDNQLRGRSGRQGDAGSSQFYLSLKDNLLRIFATDKIGNMLKRLGVKEDDVIQHGLISRAIENAQRRVEGMNFDVRKQLLEFDDVANDQRKVVYSQRRRLLDSDSISDSVAAMVPEVVADLVEQYVPAQSIEEEWDLAGLQAELQQDFLVELDMSNWLESDDALSDEIVLERVTEAVQARYEQRAAEFDPELVNKAQRHFMLQLLDQHWKDHLAAMDHLRKGIYLRSYAQKDPTQEFKRESFDLFTNMWSAIKYELISLFCRVEISDGSEVEQDQPKMNMTYQHAPMQGVPVPQVAAEEDGAVVDVKPETFVRPDAKVGRNDPCPCGSGKKYKQCHGKVQ